MSEQIDFPVFDADHHLYETEDCFTRYLPEDLSGLFRYVQLNGRTKLVVRGRLSEFVPNPTFEVVAPPGSTGEYFAGRNTHGKSLREMMGKPMRSIPAFRNPDDRLTVLDEFGEQAALVFPTLASLIEVNFLDVPEVTTRIIHAFNKWLLDDWGFNHRDRIFCAPILCPAVVDDALRELSFILEHGAKVALVRPGPVAGHPRTRSPFLPEFDPFWAAVQEANLPIALHASDSGYQRYVNDWQGQDGEMSGFKPNPFTIASMGHRDIEDTIYSAICHGMLSRFPGVKLISVENGGSWVPSVLHGLDLTYRRLPQDFREHPRETFGRSIWVNPFWEDSIDTLIDAIGAERVCFGSDWPHAEGLANPISWLSEIEHRRPDEIRRMMGQNLYDLLGTSPLGAAA